MDKKISLFCCLIIYLWSIPTHANDNSVSITSIVNNCSSCHGYNNQGNIYVPSIIGLKKKDFILKMKKYRELDKSTSMYRIAKALTNDDIINLANFYFD